MAFRERWWSTRQTIAESRYNADFSQGPNAMAHLRQWKSSLQHGSVPQAPSTVTAVDLNASSIMKIGETSMVAPLEVEQQRDRHLLTYSFPALF